MKASRDWRYINQKTHLKVVGINGIPFILNDTSIVQVGYITIETKQAARIGNNTFLFVHRGLHLSSQVEKELRYVQYGPLLLSQ